MLELYHWSIAGIAVGLMLIGVWGVLTRRNIIRIALAFTVADTGVNLLLVWTGHLPGRTTPIHDSTVSVLNPTETMVDPLPQALVLTSIVIGVAVAALFVVVAVHASRKTGSTDIRRLRELRW